MYSFFKRLLSLILTRSLYFRLANFIKKIIFNINYFFCYSNINIDNKINIKQDLIIIGQIQRSGGTLLSQLFDGHSQIYNYPSELKISEPKHLWENGFKFTTYHLDSLLVKSSKFGDYKKDGLNKNKNKIKKINKFKFNFYKQKKIFNSYKPFQNNRQKFNAYFSSFFSSFVNYSGHQLNKKYIVAFTPRLFNSKKNINIFFDLYKKGKMISIIREPENWFVSSYHHTNEYKDFDYAMNLWCESLKNTIWAKKKWRNKVIIINFNDLVKNTNSTMKKICFNLNIKFSKEITVPTFNNEHIRSDSSFKSVIGKVDKNVTNNKLRNKFVKLNPHQIKKLSNFKKIFKKAISSKIS